MKGRFLLLSAFLATVSGMFADIIVMTDGSTMNVYNIEAASKWVYYTESAEADAPVKRIAIEKVFAYKVGDGPLTNVGAASAQEIPAQKLTQAPTSGPRMIDPVPAADNNALIAAYNSLPDLVYKGKKPQPDKYTNYFLAVWGIEEGSVLSDANIEIGFDKVYLNDDKKGRVIGNRLKVTNNTASPVYLDLASCFKIMNGNHAVPYFTNSTYVEGKGGSNGASLNLGAVAGAFGIGGFAGAIAGGMNVGGSASTSAEIQTVEQQILTIPAYSSVFLPGLKVSNGKEIVECYEPLYFSNTDMKVGRGGMVKTILGTQELTIMEDKKMQRVPDSRTATCASLDIHPWIQTNYQPAESPKKTGRIITYSTSPDFSTYTSLPVKLYIRGAYGIKGTGWVQTEFNDETYEPIEDYEHLIIGSGAVKK